MTGERPTVKPEYAEFTECRDMADRVELVLDLFDFTDGDAEGVRQTHDIPVIPSRGFNELYAESAWTLRFETEHIGLRPVHVICRIVCTGKTNGDDPSVTEVIYGIDTREYVRKVAEEPLILDTTEIWRYVRSGQPGKTGTRVTWQSGVGVMVPAVIEGGVRVVLVRDQVDVPSGYATKSDIAFLTVFLDQAEAYGKSHLETESKDDAPAKLGRAGMHLAYSDKEKSV